jgi:3-deoxy-D-manno-octulosonic-acid transferase
MLFPSRSGPPCRRTTAGRESFRSVAIALPLWTIILPAVIRPLLWAGYQLATGLALVTAGPVLIARRGRHYLPTIKGRLGRYAPVVEEEAGAALWLHAVSVGEVGVAATLARALPAELPLVVTTVTPTGQERAQVALGARGPVAYLPFELGFAVRRFFDRFRPGALILIEGDYWPLVLREAEARRVPVAVVNGRVSDRSFRRLLRLRPWLGPMFGGVDRFGMQTEEDRARLVHLGVEPARVTVTGNLKYESPEPVRKPVLEADLTRLAAGRAILVAGSTMPGEEEQVLDALARLGGGERALLVLAPRHPERWAEVDRLLAERGVERVRRSRFPAIGRPEVVLLDSLGELAGLYALAAAAFVGGTLVPTGGHNPLEPARFAVPTAVGPAMDNFKEMADQFDREGAWRRVASPAELAEVWTRWLDEPAAARAQGLRAVSLVERNRGALQRTLELLRPLLSALPAAHLANDPSRAPRQG